MEYYSSKYNVLLVIVSIICMVLLHSANADAGDEGEQPLQNGTERSHGLPSTTNSPAASRELSAAQRMVKAGEYSSAVPRLEHIIQKYPNDIAGIEARFFLGKAYYSISAFSDALRLLNEYLALMPEGPYAEEALVLTGRLQNPQDLSEVDKRISELRKISLETPEELAPKLELADLLWTSGRYEEALPIYEDLLKRWPGLKSDMIVRQRIAFDASGTILALTPDEIDRRNREEEPLKLYNISAFKSGRYEGWPATAKEKYYNVSGIAVNQSDQPLDDVYVTITIYGLGQMVYETQRVYLGTLPPGEKRPFSAQFSRFDTLENIVRYECEGTFTRR